MLKTLFPMVMDGKLILPQEKVTTVPSLFRQFQKDQMKGIVFRRTKFAFDNDILKQPLFSEQKPSQLNRH